jgi:hypothetical protein
MDQMKAHRPFLSMDKDFPGMEFTIPAFHRRQTSFFSREFAALWAFFSDRFYHGVTFTTFTCFGMGGIID